MTMKFQQLLFLLAALLLTNAAEYARATGDVDYSLEHYPGFEEPVRDEDETTTMTEELVNTLSQETPSLFESDIVLTNEQRAIIENSGESFDPHGPQRAIIKHDGLWPDGKVPYFISSSLGSKARSAISAAINAYSSATCIQFYPRNSEKDYVYFFQGDGCYSSVGRVGGSQRISIGRGCEYKGIVMHEMFHALGRWHEQSRPDRDQFISVNYDNMKDGVAGNFLKLPTSQVTTQGVPYDFSSIMHYSAYAFSRNGKPTIVPKDKSISVGTLGQRTRLSTKDLQHLNALYCNDASTASWSSWGSWSTCSRTCNGGIRSRLRTCNGGNNCQGSNIQEQSCNTQSCPEVVPSWSEWSSWSGCSETCGGGRQSRTRRCLNGNTCPGAAVIYRDCNTQTCPVPVGTWSSWSNWNQCSASCDGGIQTRTRQCLSTPCDGESSIARICNTIQCPTGPAGLKHEGCYRVVAGYGLYLLEGRFDYLNDNPFRRTQAVEKCAKAASMLTYSVMAVSAGYCISGNDRLSDYKRFSGHQCKDGRGAYSSGVFYMDVYSITDPKTSNDDIPQIVSDPNAEDDSSTDGDQLTSTGGSSSSSLSMMTRTSALVVACIAALTILLSNV